MNPIELSILFKPDSLNAPQVKTFKVEHQTISIGTGEACDFVLKDRSSQRYHAHIERDEDGMVVVRHMGTGALIRTNDGRGHKNLYLTRGLEFWVGRDMFEVTSLGYPKKAADWLKEQGLEVEPEKAEPSLDLFWVENRDHYYLVGFEDGHRKVVGSVAPMMNEDVWLWVLTDQSKEGTEDDLDRAKDALKDALKNAPPKSLRIFGREAEVRSDGVGVAYTVNRFPFRGTVWTVPTESGYQWAIYPFGVPGAPPLVEGHNVSPDKASWALGDAAIGFLTEMDTRKPWH